MEMTYRQARRAYSALTQISAIRDQGVKNVENGQPIYTGKLITPAKVKMKIRRNLRVLEGVEKDLSEQFQEMSEDIDTSDEDEVIEFNKKTREIMDMIVPNDLEIFTISATDLGEKALQHIPDSLFPDLGPLFIDDEGEDGAGDPRSREERRD